MFGEGVDVILAFAQGGQMNLKDPRHPHGAESCRFATRPPCRDGRATRPLFGVPGARRAGPIAPGRSFNQILPLV
jgi:hypothetical protein